MYCFVEKEAEIVLYFVDKVAEISEQGGVYNLWPKWKRDVNSGEWNHFCFQISVSQRRFTIIHNGYIQASHLQPKLWAEVKNEVPSTFFKPLDKSKNPWEGMLLTLSGNAKGRFLSGYISDVHFWRRSLSINEMFNFTTCQSFQPGDILPWNADDWRIYNGDSIIMLIFFIIVPERFVLVSYSF